MLEKLRGLVNIDWAFQPQWARRVMENLKNYLFYAVHRLMLRLGLFVTPLHYHAAVPDILKLEATKETWAEASSLPGIDFDLDQQVAELRRIYEIHSNEYRSENVYQLGLDRLAPKSPLGPMESMILFALTRDRRPERVIEVGSGLSTYCISRALELNRNKQRTSTRSALTVIDPNATEAVSSLPQVSLRREQVQAVDPSTFLELGPADLLFIDSSHTVKPGGDVNYLVLEILPRLQSGVIVHFHDIYFPYDYQPTVLRTFFHWSETSLLRAFLIHNSDVEILLSLSLLHYGRQAAVQEIFPDYRPLAEEDGILLEDWHPFENLSGHFPCSTYIRIK